ncbi:hypothetical protein ACP70R_047398 [Stipagrostis hirtigluma subsp. patula]
MSPIVAALGTSAGRAAKSTATLFPSVRDGGGAKSLARPEHKGSGDGGRALPLYRTGDSRGRTWGHAATTSALILPSAGKGGGSTAAATPTNPSGGEEGRPRRGRIRRRHERWPPPPPMWGSDGDGRWEGDGKKGRRRSVGRRWL